MPRQTKNGFGQHPFKISWCARAGGASASIGTRHGKSRATLSPPPARRQARTRTAACRGIFVGWDLKSGLERRRTRKLLAKSEPAFDEKASGSGVCANSTIHEDESEGVGNFQVGEST